MASRYARYTYRSFPWVPLSLALIIVIGIGGVLALLQAWYMSQVITRSFSRHAITRPALFSARRGRGNADGARKKEPQEDRSRRTQGTREKRRPGEERQVLPPSWPSSVVSWCQLYPDLSDKP